MGDKMIVQSMDDFKTLVYKHFDALIDDIKAKYKVDISDHDYDLIFDAPLEDLEDYLYAHNIVLEYNYN